MLSHYFYKKQFLNSLIINKCINILYKDLFKIKFYMLYFIKSLAFILCNCEKNAS